jgi:hypothetical protein
MGKGDQDVAVDHIQINAVLTSYREGEEGRSLELLILYDALSKLKLHAG